MTRIFLKSANPESLVPHPKCWALGGRINSGGYFGPSARIWPSGAVLYCVQAAGGPFLMPERKETEDGS
jgi:hypothetical protein